MKKRFLGFICILYSIIIIYAMISNKLKNYLAPNMQIYLELSVIPLLIIGLILCLNNKINYKFKISDLILLLPLFMLLFSGDGRLNASFAVNRMTNMNLTNKTQKDNKQEEDIVVTPDLDLTDDTQDNNELANETYDFTNPYFDINDRTYDTLANYITFASKASKFIGKTIRVRGFAITNAAYLAPGYFSIGKYGISCCAADANFVGFIAKYDPSKVENNKWYELEGVIEEGIYDKTSKIMAIRVINIKEINGKNEEQYVYPCYSYEDSMCTELHKYDLEY